MIRIVHNWKDVLLHSWCLRLTVLSAMLTGAELLLPLFLGERPGILMTIIVLVITVAAAIARLVAQQAISGPPKGET